MKHNLYAISLGLTILLTLAAFFLLFGWAGTLIIAGGRLPLQVLIPWKTIALLAVAAANCTIRAECIAHKRQKASSHPLPE